MKYIIIISFILLSCNNSKENNLEQEALNDVFLSLIGEPKYYVSLPPPPLPDEYLEGKYQDEFHNEYLQHLDDSLIDYKVKNSKLLFFILDSLYQFESFAIKEYEEDLEINFHYKSLSTIPFQIEKLTNTQNYVLSAEEYPSVEERKTTRMVEELGLLKFSRIAFNKEKNEGAFIFQYYKNPENAFCYLIFIEKKENWKIVKRISIWVS
ncbi:MAG: hypothetical protein WAU11_12400 [Ignavibacteriaceae bacterium]